MFVEYPNYSCGVGLSNGPLKRKKRKDTRFGSLFRRARAHDLLNTTSRSRGRKATAEKLCGETQSRLFPLRFVFVFRGMAEPRERERTTVLSGKYTDFAI